MLFYDYSGSQHFATTRAVSTLSLAAAFYGFSVGLWNAPRLGLYAALKMPVLLLSTAMVNALAHLLLARRLGAGVTLRDSLESVLQCFAEIALLLASVAPVLMLFDLTLPTLSDASAERVHHALGLVHVAAISWAGSVAVKRQAHRMATHTDAALAKRVTWTWLTLNLVVGAQLSWNLRPWFGSPGMVVELLRPDPFDGTFYEAVLRMLAYLIVGHGD